MHDDLWAETESEWLSFLEAVRAARSAVGTTYAGAWFRGQTHDWDLSPSLFRDVKKLENKIVVIEKEIRTCKAKLVKAEAYLRRQTGNQQEDALTIRFNENINRLNKKLSRLRQRLPQNGHMPGEGRAFIEFRFRSGSHYQSSWQTLAEMQHYGVPTRLLDWTESFIHALSFALEHYATALLQKWHEDRHSDNPPRKLRWHDINISHTDANGKEIFSEPAIWILNPYKLSEISKEENVLWDPTLNTLDDYYNLFVDKNVGNSRIFSAPIPILSPWKDERIAAQRGVFTCHGTEIIPLNKQISFRAVRPVKITPCAAIHGVRFLSEVGALDRFAMFRDKDSLGKKTRSEFLSIPI